MKKIIPLLFCICFSLAATAQWYPVQSPFIGSLYSVAFGSQNVGAIGGANYNVLLTTNGGLSWTLAPGTTAVNYSLGNDIQFTDTNTIYIGSNAGKLIKSIDQGQSWTNADPVLPYGFAIHSVCFPSATCGYTGGTLGEMSRTLNSGVTWTDISINTSNDLNDVYFFNNTTGIVIGENGYVRKTSSSGIIWTSCLSGTTNTLNKMHFLNASDGFAVGNGGTILKTTNGGSSWSTIVSPTTLNLYGISFKTDMEGFIVGASGTILKTVNGGITWQIDASPTTITLNDIKFNGSNFVIVGYGGTILTDVPTGMNENVNENSIVLFPNPSSDGHFTITGIEKNNFSEIHVYDVLGNEAVAPILSAQFNGTLDLPRRGVYFVVMEGEDGSLVKKVIW